MAEPAGTGEKKKSRFSPPAHPARSVPRQLSLNPGFVLPANGPRAHAAASALPGPVPAATGCWVWPAGMVLGTRYLGSTDHAGSWIRVPQGLMGS